MRYSNVILNVTFNINGILNVIKIEKHKFYRYKCPIFLEDLDIENV